METSTTHYDADFVPIAFNAEPKPVAVYDHDATLYAGTTHLMENLIWLIASNRDQALHMLHMQLQGKIKILIMECESYNFIQECIWVLVPKCPPSWRPSPTQFGIMMTLYVIPFVHIVTLKESTGGIAAIDAQRP